MAPLLCPQAGPSLAPLTSLGSREMKSLWNCGSITCIMYLIWEGSQRSMSSSSASSFSGPLHLWAGQRVAERAPGRGASENGGQWPRLHSGSVTEGPLGRGGGSAGG
uniref:Uncharacterized protein n=1 Tax=Gopherus evgoodei TaxID=1825980 RepID=A0A8C4YE59_9SAUR